MCEEKLDVLYGYVVHLLFQVMKIYYLKDEPYMEVLLCVVNESFCDNYVCDNQIWECDIEKAHTELYCWAFNRDFISVLTETYYIDYEQRDFVRIRKNAYYGPHQQFEIQPLAVLANTM